MRILRYTVPDDGEWHAHTLYGQIVHVAARTPDKVEFWAFELSHVPPVRLEFRVYGTGQEIPDNVKDAVYVGTALAPENLVWHLFLRDTKE